MRKLFSIVFSAVLLLIGSAQGTWAQKAKVYDLGHYPGGTWAAPSDISNSGVVVGAGDVPSGGIFHAIGVPLFGPKAGQWFDLGTLGGDYIYYVGECNGIANTGMIVGFAPITGGDILHAFAWTPKSGMVDLGTLENVGYSGSSAHNVNKAGTLIVGMSGTESGDMLPVVWMPKVVWTSGGPTTTWNIQKLDTEGFGLASLFYATGVNDFGQIIGTRVDNLTGAEIAVVWNPVPGGKGWKIRELPASSDYPFAYPSDINDKGEIVGALASPDWGTFVPALWKKESRSGNIWNLTVLATPSGSIWNDALGINDLGDIVGVTADAYWNALAVRWSTKDPNFVRVLDFPGAGSPGAWSEAIRVNDSRIAVGWYGSNTILQNVFAVQVLP